MDALAGTLPPSPRGPVGDFGGDLASEAAVVLAEMLGGRPLPASEISADLVERGIEALGARLEDSVATDELVRLTASMRVLLRAGRELSARDARRALEGTRRGLVELRGHHEPEQFVARGLKALADSGDFDRVVLFRVEHGSLIPHQAAVPESPQLPQDVLRDVTARPTAGVTNEALRRRAPVLATTGEAGGQYLVAPLLPADQVIGLLYVDRTLTGRALNRVDREMLWAFAEGFGFALERSVLQSRLRAEQRYFHQLAASGDAVLAELANAPVTLAPGNSCDPGLGMVVAPPELVSADGQHVLTPRELEVMPLLAEGARNRDIARRLCISEETVKSHVQRILKKLGAANRAEAVSRYLQLVSTAR